ncbi:15372_t:CDS:10 [Entrophospora sp. SA101]|nr:15372_t:CDS:10 [Entrophospora sp. SA101]
MVRLCIICNKEKAIVKRPKTGQQACKECFYYVFETEVHNTITDNKLFKKGDKVAIAASGGKDSTVLAYVLKLLNERYNYDLDLFLLSVDEGITEQYELPLKIVSYSELYGWSMDQIVKEVGLKNNCTFCGVFRRQALDRGAALLKVDHVVTGHNADDIAETVLMNILRGDIARLQRCTEICTTGEDCIRRSKPFKYTYEKEIVMYAYFKKLDYFSTECIYSPNSYRGHVRTFLKDLEAIRPSTIIDIIYSGEAFQVKNEVKLPVQGMCKRCGYISSNELCKACVLLEGLNRGLPRFGIGKTHKMRKLYGDTPENLPSIPFFNKKINDDQNLNLNILSLVMSFPQLFKKSKLATYDPALPQVYKTYGHYKGKGEWGVKRNLPKTTHSDVITIRAFDTTEHQTIFNSVQGLVKFPRKWKENFPHSKIFKPMIGQNFLDIDKISEKKFKKYLKEAESRREDWYIKITKDQKKPSIVDYLEFLNLNYQSQTKRPVKGLTYSHNNTGSSIIVQGRILNRGNSADYSVGVGGLVTRLPVNTVISLTQIDRSKLETFYVEKAEFDAKGTPRVSLTKLPNILNKLKSSTNNNNNQSTTLFGSRTFDNISDEDKLSQEAMLNKIQDIFDSSN